MDPKEYQHFKDKINSFKVAAYLMLEDATEMEKALERFNVSGKSEAALQTKLESCLTDFDREKIRSATRRKLEKAVQNQKIRK